nr:ribonucleotide-diphosphate reductase subunit beta [Raoultella sp. NCTC 9187]
MGRLSVPRWFNDCLNRDILCQYVEYITNIRMQAVGLELPFQTRSNPSRGSIPGWYPITCRLRRRKWKSAPTWWGRSDAEVDADDLSNFQL